MFSEFDFIVLHKKTSKRVIAFAFPFNIWAVTLADSRTIEDVAI
jgi:hypothetical protein